MSLGRLLLGIATAQALRNATDAGARVYAEKIDPIANLNEEAQPLIGVYMGDYSSSSGTFDVLAENTSLEICLQILVPAQCRAIDEDSVEIYIPGTADGAALIQNIVAHQALRVLRKDRTAWSDLWRDLILASPHGEKARLKLQPVYIDIGEGLRVSALEIRMQVTPLPDPEVSIEDNIVFLRALTLMQRVPDLSPVVSIIRRAFGLGDHNPETEPVTRTNLSDGQFQALGGG